MAAYYGPPTWEEVSEAAANVRILVEADRVSLGYACRREYHDGPNRVYSVQSRKLLEVLFKETDGRGW